MSNNGNNQIISVNTMCSRIKIVKSDSIVKINLLQGQLLLNAVLTIVRSDFTSLKLK